MRNSVNGSGLAAQGWVKLNSATPLAGLCFIGSNSGMADVPVSETLESSLVVPHIAQDDFWDTTLMVCNPSDNAINLQIIYNGFMHRHSPNVLIIRLSCYTDKG